jgi:hypothetical protein
VIKQKLEGGMAAAGDPSEDRSQGAWIGVEPFIWSMTDLQHIARKLWRTEG